MVKSVIKEINLTEVAAKRILEIQIPAYEIEAKLIGFAGIPQLKDTVDSIINSEETFLGYFSVGELVAVVAYTFDDNVSVSIFERD